MANPNQWKFYGRQRELSELRAVLARNRWFFAKLTGRRRIGKTTLVQQALNNSTNVFYVQLPDSQQRGVVSAIADSIETFRVTDHPAPNDLREVAQFVGRLARSGRIVVLDEFQYVNRPHLTELTSALQAEVDTLASKAAEVRGGLIVLGSLHTEMAALLEDRNAPLYNRTTDEIGLGHLDVVAIADIIRDHAEYTPERLLFLWSLFEGVPKFYRDCFEQDVLAAPRRDLLRRIFFESSSPLRYEAENWFLKEFRGRYDVVLKFIARNVGADHKSIQANTSSPENAEQVGGYIKVLSEKYRMIERRLPIFAKPNARKGRYYITDNFLRSWLAALANPVAAMNFRPVDDLVADADAKLAVIEGYALEKLAGQLYEERSRQGVGEFPMTHRVQGYWNSADTEIDLVAVNDTDRRIRFGSCRRSGDELLKGAQLLDGHVSRFLGTFRQYADWSIEKVGIAPSITASVRAQLESSGHIPQSLDDLLQGLV